MRGKRQGRQPRCAHRARATSIRPALAEPQCVLPDQPRVRADTETRPRSISPGRMHVTPKALVIALALPASPAVAACNEPGTGTKDTPIFSPPLGAVVTGTRAPAIPFGAKRALRDGRCALSSPGIIWSLMLKRATGGPR